MSGLEQIIDSLDVERLKARVSEKWNTYPPDVLPAWVAEMDYPLADPIREVLATALENNDLGYPIGLRDTGLPKVFSERMADRYGWETDLRRVDVITDIVQGIYVAVEVLSEPGDGVIVQTPIYPPFLSAVADTKRRLVENRMVAGHDGWEIDFDALRAAIDERTRIFLLCNPHNPTGRVFRRDELEQIAQIACEHNLVVVADEVHSDLVFDARVHIPIASLSEEIATRTITLTSATKAFNIPGLRCAVAHFGSEHLQQRYRSIPHSIRGGVGLLGIYATIAAWQRSQAWLDEVRAYLEGNRDYLADFASTRLPNIVYHPNEATYLAWLDCSAAEIPGSPATHILEDQRLALNDGRTFGEGFEKFARLNFATSRRILAEILERVEKATQSR
ncbi:MAG: PatB family C-S lyase [Deltaproteobacteria bacterium]|nr:PatB family C-S lyase [Deltaproteobacteria bacterium]MBW2386951.1 PatB family C-S lyase [Deltaproteobacteria bacterium]MBW2722992.1 PatB family C-S lyase [Deltaproteobacteria bacterium]